VGVPNLQMIRVLVSPFYDNTCGVCGVDSKEVASIHGGSWVFANFIGVLICLPRLRFRLFFCLGVSRS